jgi:hypothetical protein
MAEAKPLAESWASHANPPAERTARVEQDTSSAKSGDSFRGPRRRRRESTVPNLVPNLRKAGRRLLTRSVD